MGLVGLAVRCAAVLASLAVCRGAGTADEDDIPRGLHRVVGDDASSVNSFVAQYSAARGAVAVARVGEDSKRHKFLQDVLLDPVLFELLVVGVQFTKGPGNLTMYRDGEAPAVFGGRWTRTELRAWLVREAYPLVASLTDEFRAQKYFDSNPFGVVLVSQTMMRRNATLARFLEPFARQYHDKLKFTFFTNVSRTLRNFTRRFGIWTSDELLLAEQPQTVQFREHRNDPPTPKFRLVGLSNESIVQFFQGYAAGTLPQYYIPEDPTPRIVTHDFGIRDLTAWDFDAVTQDPRLSVLVLFVSKDCTACYDFWFTYRKLAERVQAELRRSPDGPFKELLLARIDQTANEHSALVEGTPCLRYWPRGQRKRPQEILVRGEVDHFFDALDRHLTQEAEQASEEL